MREPTIAHLSLGFVLCSAAFLVICFQQPLVVGAKTHHSKRQAPTSGPVATGRENTNWWDYWWQQYIDEAVQPTVRPIVGVSFNGRSIRLNDNQVDNLASPANNEPISYRANAEDHDHTDEMNFVASDSVNKNSMDIERSEKLRLIASSESSKSSSEESVARQLPAQRKSTQQQANWQSVKPTMIQTSATRDSRLNRQVPALYQAEEQAREVPENMGIQMRAAMNPARQSRSQVSNEMAQQKQLDNLIQQQQQLMDDMRFEQQQQHQMVDYTEESEAEMEVGSNMDLEGGKTPNSVARDSSSSSMMMTDQQREIVESTTAPTTQQPNLDSRLQNQTRDQNGNMIMGQQEDSTLDQSRKFERKQSGKGTSTGRGEQQESFGPTTSLTTEGAQTTQQQVDGSSTTTPATTTTTTTAAVSLTSATTTTTAASINSDNVNVNETPISIEVLDEKQPTRGTTSSGRVELQNGKPASGMRQQATTTSSRLPTRPSTTSQMRSTTVAQVSSVASTTMLPTTQTSVTITTMIPPTGKTKQIDVAVTRTMQETTTTTSRPDLDRKVSTVSGQSTRTRIEPIQTTTTSSLVRTETAKTTTENRESNSSSGDSDDDEDDESTVNQSGGTNLMNMPSESNSDDTDDSNDDSDDSEDVITTTSKPTGTSARQQQQPISTKVESTTNQLPSIVTMDIERLPKAMIPSTGMSQTQTISQSESGGLDSDSRPTTVSSISNVTNDIKRIKPPSMRQQQPTTVMIPLDQSRDAISGETAITMPLDTLMKMMMNQMVPEDNGRTVAVSLNLGQQQQPKVTTTTTTMQSSISPDPTTTGTPAFSKDQSTIAKTTKSEILQVQTATTTTTERPSEIATQSTTTTSAKLTTANDNVDTGVSINDMGSNNVTTISRKKLRPSPPPTTTTKPPGSRQSQIAVGNIAPMSSMDSTSSPLGGNEAAMEKTVTINVDTSQMMSGMGSQAGVANDEMPSNGDTSKIEMLNLDLLPIQRIMNSQQQQMQKLKADETRRPQIGNLQKQDQQMMDQILMAEVEPGMRLRPMIGTKTMSGLQSQVKQQSGFMEGFNTPPANTAYMIMMNGATEAHSKKPMTLVSIMNQQPIKTIEQQQRQTIMPTHGTRTTPSIATTTLQQQMRTSQQPMTTVQQTTTSSKNPIRVTPFATTTTTRQQPTTQFMQPTTTAKPRFISNTIDMGQRQADFDGRKSDANSGRTTQSMAASMGSIAPSMTNQVVDNNLVQSRQSTISGGLSTPTTPTLTTMRTLPPTSTRAPERFTTNPTTTTNSIMSTTTPVSTIATSISPNRDSVPTTTTASVISITTLSPTNSARLMQQQLQKQKQTSSIDQSNSSTEQPTTDTTTNSPRENNQSTTISRQSISGGGNRTLLQQEGEKTRPRVSAGQTKSGKINSSKLGSTNVNSSFIPTKLRNNFNATGTKSSRQQQQSSNKSATSGNKQQKETSSGQANVTEIGGLAQSMAIRQFGGANRMSVIVNQPVPFGRPAAMTIQQVQGGSSRNNSSQQQAFRVELPTFEYGPSIAVRRPDEPLANGQVPNCTLTGKNFCVLTKDYPMNEVRQAVERSFRSVRIMYEELQTVSDQELHKDDFNATNNQAATGKFACQTQVEMMRPGWAKDEITKEWMLVVNTDVFPQRVRTESCAQPNTPCEFIAPFYDSTCQQRYSLHRMIAIDPHDPSRSPQVAVFRFPAGCVCRVHPIKKTTMMQTTSK